MLYDINYLTDMNFGIKKCVHGATEHHNHNFFELAYVCEGTTVHNLDGVETRLKKGAYFIVDYHKYHSFDVDKNSEIKLINCFFTAEFIDKSLKNCHKFSELIKCYLLKYDYNILIYEPTRTVFYDDDGYILDILQKMQSEYQKKPVAYTELMRFYLLEIIIHTLRKITDRNLASDSDCIKEVVDYIEENYNMNIKLHNIAENKNYSLAYLSRKFKDSTGITFSEYLQRTRIKESCRLLLNTDKKVIEIAYLCGYKDVNNFNKLFKKYMGITPLSFRKGNVTCIKD